MVGEAERITSAVAASLIAGGYRVRQILPGRGARSIGPDRYEVDLADAGCLREAHSMIAGAEGATVGAVVNFLGITDPFCRPGCEDHSAPFVVCHWTFNLLKEFQVDLESSAKDGGGWLVNLTALGGTFAVESAEAASLAAAGTLGIAKTFFRECPKTSVKNIDVDLALDPNLLAGRILEELSADDDAIEVGWTKAGRFRLRLLRDEPQPDGTLDLDRDAVVVVTGGAYGVTAEVAKSLADRFACRLVLIGRSALPTAEPAQTAGLDAAGLRRTFIETARQNGTKALPAEIEKAVQRTLRNRQILANLAHCRDAGSDIEYHALDVRDAAAFGGLIDGLYARYGRIDGVIHGAGVIEDKRIRDKSPKSFENVFRTKVDCALNLVDKLRPEGLKFLVFFSSVSGRFGNAGQADYSAANEFLNKLADWLDSRWPARVIAINWGPWDGGMVTDELRRLYAQVGFELIPVPDGIEHFLNEIRRDSRRSSEIVVSASVDKMTATGV